MKSSPGTPANRAVRIVEVGPRDGLQNIPQQVPTAVKLALIQRLIKAGLSTVEATSCVSPKWVPQLADSKDVLTQLRGQLEHGAVSLPVLVPNLQGLDAALRHPVREVAVFVSASEGFSRKNTNCSVSEALERARQVVSKARQHGVIVRGYVSCIIECPYDGPTPPSAVLRVTRELLAMGCYEVSLGDTLGVGAPSDVEALLSVLLAAAVPAGRLAGHFHDTYGQALANVMKAYSMGLRTFDSSVAGLGGCPYARGARGNLATEDVVYAFERHGVPTGVDLGVLAATGQWISEVLKQANGSRAGAALAARFQQEQLDQQGRNKDNNLNNNAPDPTIVTSTKEPDKMVPPATTTTSAVSTTKTPTTAGGRGEPSGWRTFQKSERFTVARKGRSVLVKLTRPRQANVLTAPLVRELTDTIRSLSSQAATVSRIAITGEGRYFCSGMDLHSRAQAHGLAGLLDAISQAPQVTVALVNGPCFGGGVGLAFACDVRLAASAATFTLSEARLGFAPAFVAPYVVREWGPALARAAMVTARPVTAHELYRIGAVHAVYDDDEEETNQDGQRVMTRVLDEFLEGLHVCAPQASELCKNLVRVAWEDPGGEREKQVIGETADKMMDSDEANFGVEEFAKKGVKGIDWDAWYSKLASKL